MNVKLNRQALAGNIALWVLPVIALPWNGGLARAFAVCALLLAGATISSHSGKRLAASIGRFCNSVFVLILIYPVQWGMDLVAWATRPFRHYPWQASALFAVFALGASAQVYATRLDLPLCVKWVAVAVVLWILCLAKPFWKLVNYESGIREQAMSIRSSAR